MDLERAIEGQLALDHRFPQSIHLSYTIHEGQLMVLVHCPEATRPNSQALFHRIRGIIASDRPSQLESLQLYLIIHGQRILPTIVYGDNQIRLTLTAAYLAQVWNNSLTAQANVPTQMAILNQVARLEQNLQVLSQKTGLAIAVYNPQGTLIARYEVR